MKLKKISYLVAGLIVVFAFSAFLVNKNMKSPEFTGPAIVFDEEVHDFGKVKEGPQLEYSFKFTNNGNDILKIISVSTSCGCTAAAPDKKEYMTGESGHIKVSFNTQGRQGVQHKDITVTSNDPKNPTKTLKITTEIQR